MDSDIDFSKLEDELGFTFLKKEHRTRALTRRAYAKEEEDKQKERRWKHQEAYCVLGDAVLKTILSDRLIEKGCETRKDITETKKEYESQVGLSKVAKKKRIGRFILKGVGEKKQNADKQPRVQAETLEALIGAMFLDRGYKKTKKAVLKWFEL